MPLESVQEIVGRAITEPEYRELLFADPDEALGGYDLTEEEAAALKGLERERFDTVARELEERISKSGIGPLEIKIQDDLWTADLDALREMKFDSDIVRGLFDGNLEGRG